MLVLSAVTILSLWAVMPGEGRALTGRMAPEISSPTWLNSEPLSREHLRGKVTLVEFWTFGCYNCRNIEPYIKAWHSTYASRGLVVIGIHSPEFSFERDVAAVRDYVTEHEVTFPVAIDNDFINWRRFENRYWPAIYLIDKRGVVRYVRIGEGGYSATEQKIKQLLSEDA